MGETRGQRAKRAVKAATTAFQPRGDIRDVLLPLIAAVADLADDAIEREQAQAARAPQHPAPVGPGEPPVAGQCSAGDAISERRCVLETGHTGTHVWAGPKGVTGAEGEIARSYADHAPKADKR